MIAKKANWQKELLNTLKKLNIVQDDESCQLTIKLKRGSIDFVNKAENLK